jgi:copper(I)-binding protein
MLGSLLVAMAVQGLALERAIVRAAPAGEDAAAYVAIVNPGGEDRLVGASCDCAESVEIHRAAGGMHVEPSLPVPAAGRTEIRPGGEHHLMLMRLRGPIAEGARVPLILRFERAGPVTATADAVGDTRAAWALVPELAPIAWLVGSCWRATFPNTTHTDTHCYTPMHGGRQVRDVHVVEGAPAPYSGETVYRWDPIARRIRYDYYASDGGYSAGSVEPTPTGLAYPEEVYTSGTGERMTLRNSATRESAEAYIGMSEMRQSETWREMWRMRFTRVGPAPAR